MIALDEPGWRRIYLSDLFRNRSNGFIHHNVFGRLDDFEFGNASVLLDADFDQGRNLGAGGDVGSRLDPCAVKAIVQHVAIPAEL